MNENGSELGGETDELRVTILPITNHAQHQIAFDHLEKLMLQDPAPGSSDEVELAALAHAVSAFEKRAFPV